MNESVCWWSGTKPKRPSLVIPGHLLSTIQDSANDPDPPVGVSEEGWDPQRRLRPEPAASLVLISRSQRSYVSASVSVSLIACMRLCASLSVCLSVVLVEGVCVCACMRTLLDLCICVRERELKVCECTNAPFCSISRPSAPYPLSSSDDEDDQQPEKHGDDHAADGHDQLHVGLLLRP